MDFKTYQEQSIETDQAPRHLEHAHGSGPDRSDVIPLLGLVGEVGSLLGEYKKLLRDGEIHRKFKDEVAEELGDILWYVANVASKFGLSFDDIAQQNISKVRDRYSSNANHGALYDDDQDVSAQLPREFEYEFVHRAVGNQQKMHLVDRLHGDSLTGDPLTDNAYEDDGYRFHDVMHLTFAALFGWSPVYRKLLRNGDSLKKRQPPQVDEAEDGGRAQIVDEAIVLAGYAYAAEHRDMLNGAKTVDWTLLRHIKGLVANLEVRSRSANDWNKALLRGFELWRQLREHDGGIIRGDLAARKIDFTPPTSTT